jgi:hypothetical protein
VLIRRTLPSPTSCSWAELSLARATNWFTLHSLRFDSQGLQQFSSQVQYRLQQGISVHTGVATVVGINCVKPFLEPSFREWSAFSLMLFSLSLRCGTTLHNTHASIAGSATHPVLFSQPANPTDDALWNKLTTLFW